MKIVKMCLEILWFGLSIFMKGVAVIAILIMIVLAYQTPSFMEEYCAMKWDKIEAEEALWEQRRAETAQLKKKAHQAHLLELEELKETREQWARDTVLPPPGTLVQPSGP